MPYPTGLDAGGTDQLGNSSVRPWRECSVRQIRPHNPDRRVERHAYLERIYVPSGHGI